MKVIFNNKEYIRNGRNGSALKNLCFDIFRYYLEQNNDLSYKDLQTIFNKWHCNNNFVVLSKKNWEDKTEDLKKRYFDPIQYNGESIYFTTQWGNNGGDCDNINNMIDFAKTQNYDIQLIQEEIEQDNKKNDNIINIKNIILYGAPGVGKTHNYKNLISMIEEGKSQNEIFDVVSKNNKVSLENETFESIKKDGRVEFVTFHQSYSYEDFIEGFRPSEEGKIELKNGIFKIIVEKCIENSFNLEIETGIQDISEKPTIWKISLGEGGEIKNECFENNKIRLGWDNFGDLNSVGSITQRELRDFYTLEIGDIIFAFKNQWEIDGIGVVVGAYRFNDNNDNYKHERDVKWIVKNQTINVKEYNHNVRMTLSSLYRLYRISKLDVLSIIQDSHQNTLRKSLKAQQNFYIVIDEINRGNISKIFGELITLIEEDKRDVYEVTLPYSKEKFKVPSNLYIIATMNSTDKSIATIDIALRRRFTFLKMKPNENLILHVEAKKLFNALNEFIKNSLNEDYMLGHSYFMNIQNSDDLKFVKEYKIKPLLEEYFYADDENFKNVIDILDKGTTDEQK